jgi:ferredoxin-NADP reductase
VRRNYSICAPATPGELRIAVNHIRDGDFSTFAMEQPNAGDELELMSPTGRFSSPLDQENTRRNGRDLLGLVLTEGLCDSLA